MSRGNWDQATAPRPATECPRCGEDRLTEPTVTPTHTLMYCNICALSWRVGSLPERAHAV